MLYNRGFSLQGALNTLSSYSKAVNTAHSQSFVSRTDYTNNPGLIAHAPLVAHAPVVAGEFPKNCLQKFIS